ncbi:nitrite reductase [Microaerobacter geothermalis]|uniref:nitrite reductase n=1 Tax=Microaerobacter geothermalis TaxID=674972 RepID=UPI001F29B1DF|nr:nitrite reductase [Microaerobacter geothermalis]MCF6094120.1 nitrite reductase [Microaerobacter geothermalis]
MSMKKFAVTPGFEVGGSLFKPDQLALLGSIVGKNAKIELTSFQQLYVEMNEDQVEEVTKKLKEAGLQIYPVGPYVKSLKTCSFCQGAEEEGLHVAAALNKAIAGMEAPSALRVGYTGCTNACGEPLLQDIGVVKNKEVFDVYVGGEAKTLNAHTGQLLAIGVPEEKLIDVVKELILYFQQHGKKREKFSRFVNRVGIDHLKKIIHSVS